MRILYLLTLLTYCNILITAVNKHETLYFRSGNSLVIIGAFTYGYDQLRIHNADQQSFLTIGKFVSLADNINVFLSGNHRTDWITTFPFETLHHEYFHGENIRNSVVSKGGITIENDVWIGSEATIMSGVTIGNGAVIATRAVVTKDVEPYAIVGGVPARLIRYRFDKETCDLLQLLCWWDLETDQIKEIIMQLCNAPDKKTIKCWLKKYRNIDA